MSAPLDIIAMHSLRFYGILKFDGTVDNSSKSYYNICYVTHIIKHKEM